ncbi:dmt superfamily [Leptolyngbya sp. Heron Island J]|uniref:DMT family transporter n=1 Tax=Leptolyngbya sp. Heron Island J TaxID=1385935 RepID=UPI0003B94E9E|nr:DMT family transporter [Leptolyngbya sp. Heron Island J]ESA36957.1 dmt superfamily [Leptolyngbya sp. Heron Island J]
MTKIRSRQLLGIGLVLLSALALSVQNVILRLFFTPSLLWGQVSFGGFVTPQLSHVVVLLTMRMATMVLLLAGIAPWLYPSTFRVLRTLPTTPKLLGAVIASGGCLFLGLTLLYTALSQIATGIAISTFFVYPAITLLLAWYCFHHRPRPYQLWLMGVIFSGVVLTTLNSSGAISANPILGGLSATGAGLSFGLYGIFAELSLQPQSGYAPIHPVPFSLCTFFVVAVAAGLTLLFSQQITITSTAWPFILLMTVLSASLTLIAYVLNNFGIHYIGAALTAMISASNPGLTTLFAWWVLQEALQTQQIAGIALITGGVATLSLRSRR